MVSGSLMFSNELFLVFEARSDYAMELYCTNKKKYILAKFELRPVLGDYNGFSQVILR